MLDAKAFVDAGEIGKSGTDKKLSIKPDFDHKGRTPSWNLLNVPHESPFIANYRVGRVLILDGFIDVTITTPVYMLLSELAGDGLELPR